MNHFRSWTRFQKGWVSGNARKFLWINFHSNPTLVKLITDKMSLRLCFLTVCRSASLRTLNFQLIFYCHLWAFLHQFSILSYLVASMYPWLFKDGLRRPPYTGILTRACQRVKVPSIAFLESISNLNWDIK